MKTKDLLEGIEMSTCMDELTACLDLSHEVDQFDFNDFEFMQIQSAARLKKAEFSSRVNH